MAFDVFISYPHQDKAVADATCAALEADGIRCWIAPRDIVYGMDWGGAIIAALNSAKIMVLIFSGYSNASPQIKREVERAVNKGISIIPLRIENVMPNSALEYFISTSHWLDALTPPLESHLKKLAASVKTLLQLNPASATSPSSSSLPIRDAIVLPTVISQSKSRAEPCNPLECLTAALLLFNGATIFILGLECLFTGFILDEVYPIPTIAEWLAFVTLSAAAAFGTANRKKWASYFGLAACLIGFLPILSVIGFFPDVIADFVTGSKDAEPIVAIVRNYSLALEIYGAVIVATSASAAIFCLCILRPSSWLARSISNSPRIFYLFMLFLFLLVAASQYHLTTAAQALLRALAIREADNHGLVMAFSLYLGNFATVSLVIVAGSVLFYRINQISKLRTLGASP